MLAKSIMEGHSTPVLMYTVDSVLEFLKKTAFFLTAFAPLWVIMMTTYLTTHPSSGAVLSISIVAIMLVAIIVGLFKYLKRKRMVGDVMHFKVVKKSDMRHDALFYMLACVSALIVDSFEPREVVAFVVVVFVVFVLYVKTNMLYINPIIGLKYKMYRVEDHHGNEVVMFSVLNIPIGQAIPCREITHNIMIVAD